MINFKPQKGKAYDKLPAKTVALFDNTEYLMSTKYDGNQIFVNHKAGVTRWFTSDWKEFALDIQLPDAPMEYTLVGEFMYNCIGLLGDRRKSAILTTLRTNFNKGIANGNCIDTTKVNIKVFDIVSEHTLDSTYADRLSILRSFDTFPGQISIIKTDTILGKDALKYAKALVKLGHEGIMLVEPNTLYNLGKRVNHSIKIKYRPTADLRCINIEEGEGKYLGMIGSLVLVDSAGRIVKVGSGLTDTDRTQPNDYFTGKVIEIEYEQLMDTYIQPTFVCIREEKEID